MSDFLVVMAIAVITFGSRVVFLANPGSPPTGITRRFLDRFPLALFVALAASILVVRDAELDARLGWAAIGGAVLGGWVTRRSLYGVVTAGFGAYWIARLILG